MNTPRIARLLRILLIALCAIGLAAPLSACRTKPSKQDCEQAIDNLRKIRGTDNVKVGAARGRAVRSCQGNSSRATVSCFIAAKAEEDLVKCEGDTGKHYLDQERKARDDWRDKNKKKDDEGGDEGDKKDGQEGE